MRKLYPSLASVFVFFLQVTAQAQPAPPAAARSQVIGQVTSIDATSRRLVLRDDHGASVSVSVAETASVLQVPPGETDLKKASRIDLAAIGAGDRALAVGTLAEGRKEIQARTVIIMTKSDLAQKQDRELQDWQHRGIAGTVSAVDAGAQTITVQSGQRTITVTTAKQTEYRRYAPNSVQFRDAVPSSLAAIQAGDQIRVLGAKSEDGLTIAAERVVTGSFRQIAGTITSIQAGTGEIQIRDLASKKPMIISVNSASVMKKLAPDVAAALTRRLRGRSGRGGEAPRERAGGNVDVAQLLGRLDPVALADLKPGDAIMVSASAGPDPARLTAITLLAGVEPLLTAAPDAARDIMAGWSFGGGQDQE